MSPPHRPPALRVGPTDGHPRRPRLWQVFGLAILIGLALNLAINEVTSTPVWVEVLRGVVLNLALTLILAAAADRRYERAVARMVERLHDTPPILDEDGNVRIPLLLPGESLDIVMGPEDRPVAAAVRTPSGGIRVSADWTHR